jgi:hypothetical protein
MAFLPTLFFRTGRADLDPLPASTRRHLQRAGQAFAILDRAGLRAASDRFESTGSRSSWPSRWSRIPGGEIAKRDPRPDKLL